MATVDNGRTDAQIAEYALLHWVPSGVSAARRLSVMNSQVFLLLREPSQRLRWLGCSARPA